MQINWTMVKCHQQEADWECGYYVSIAMFQLMFRLQEDFPVDLWEDMSPIAQKHIDECVLSSASQFFTFYLENCGVSSKFTWYKKGILADSNITFIGLDFGEGPRERAREDSHHSSARAKTTKPERPRVQDHLRYDNRRVLDRLGYRMQSAFDRLSETYSPSTTKSYPQEADSRDTLRGRNSIHGLNTSREDRLKDREHFRSVRKSYDDSFSHSRRVGNHSRHRKRGDTKSLSSSASRSDSSDENYRRSKSERHKSTDDDDLARPWMCEEEDLFTPRIRNFESSRRTRMPNNVKTYDGTGDPEDHVNVFQAAAQVERWAMPIWCHMFNSTLIGAAREWIDELPLEIIDGYKNLKVAFLAYFMQQKKYVKDLGAPECMRISEFMHGVTNPELTNRLNEHVPKTMEEMMITTTAFIRGEVAAASKKKGHVSWKAQDQSKRQNLEKGPTSGVTQRKKRGLTGSPPYKDTERNPRGRSNTDECMQLKKQIEELVRAGKLSHLIKEIWQGRDQSKIGKKETAVKDKPATIYMVQSWQRTVKQKVTQSFERVKEITFPPLAARNRVEGPLIIEAEMGAHMIHRMYIDGGSSIKIFYEHCFNWLRPKIKNQMIPSATSLTGFSVETIWLLGQLRLLVIIGDATHSTRAWMNFMIVKSLSPYNGIIERSRLRAIQAVPFMVHGMLKFLVEGRIVTIRSTMLIPTECASVITSPVVPSKERTRPANFKVTLHPDFPDKEKLSDMTGVSRSIAEHRLNIREGYSLVRRKKRGQALERAKAIQAEVQKLVEEGIMREVYYHDWFSNPVMKVESLCGYTFKCFLDAYKDYHQIQLAEPDEENTAFHTGQGVYYYTKMPFSLKNAGTTYQRLMDKAFEGQIGRNIEVYVDDLVVKSYKKTEMIRDIEETFRTLRKVNMKLKPKSAHLGQILTDFLIEMPGEDSQAVPATVTQEEPWTLFTDGSSCVDGSGAGLILTSPEVVEITYALRFQFTTSNNEAKYVALIAGLRITAQNGEVPESSQKLGQRIYHLLNKPGTSRSAQGQIHKGEGNGNGDRGRRTDLDDTVSGLHKRRNPPRRQEGGKKAPPQGQIIRAEYVMREIHEGSCSMHARSRLVVAKAIRLGYYWPTMHNDTRDMIRKRSDCQIHHPITRYPQQPLTPVMALWPFYKWGIGIAGPFPKGPGKVKFLIVAMDYFTKWIEAKAVAIIAGGQVKKFVWDNIVCRFGIPGEIVSDNEKQFSENPFKDWCDKLNITQRIEVVIPTEIGMPTYRTAAVDVVNNDAELRLNLDLLEERHERAVICEAKAKSKMMKYYNARVRGVAFKPGDFVYRSNDTSHAVAGGKLGPKWEGPYEVTQALGN
nr:reverse transcriptase domain-containing protein [Tanacetum cinerariifolium]